MPETPGLEAIDSAVERLVSALERIATEHGSEAVDLAMTAYQLDAIRSLAFGGTFLGACILGLWLCIPFVRSLWEADIGESRFGSCLLGIGCFIGSVLAVVAGGNLASPAKWLAAFGSPEILAATNVLKSAGLM